ncbi:MAG: tetratricopeptide repeat protein [Spirochaetota bacterium]|jgi:tetratricopeptide (TPR) repeat protein|nr:tetratricopeptide repeat protein [Spirochaetota bacterium]
MRKLSILVFLVLTSALTAAAPDLFERGREHYGAGRFEIALVTLLEALKQEPENPDCYLFIGNIYSNKREFEKAIAYYRIGLDITDRPNIFHFNMGQALYYSKRYDEALVSFRNAVLGEEGIPDAWLELGRTYYQLSDKSNTIYAWQRYLRAKPDNPQAAVLRKAIQALSSEDYPMPAQIARRERERLALQEARRQALLERLIEVLVEAKSNGDAEGLLDEATSILGAAEAVGGDN